MVGGIPGWPGAPSAGSPPFRLTPSRQTYLKYARATAPVAAIFVALAVVRMATGWDDPVNRWGAAVLIVVAAGAAVTVLDYLSHSSVTVTPTEVVMVGLWRHRRVIPRTEIGLCVLVQGLASASFRGPAPNLFVLRRDGSRAMRLTEGFYPESDLIALSRALGAPVDGIAGVISPKQLRERHPGTATWLEAHPYGFAGIVVAAVVIVVVVVAAVVAGASGG